MNYRTAASDEIDTLVKQRLRFIEADEKSENYSLLRDNCCDYFRRAFAGDSCDVVLAEEDGVCVGTGIVFYYDSVPSVSNITGKNAYVTSLFVEPQHRSRGIGSGILKELISRAAARGYRVIMLNASEMGKPMYRKFGFADIENGMILKLGE